MSIGEDQLLGVGQRAGCVVLLGPISCGKTTIGKLLAGRLGLRFVDLDDLRADHYPALGYDEAEADRRQAAGGLPAKLAYWKPFEAASVERTLREHGTGCVIAFGAGQAIHEDPQLAERVRSALEAASAVVLLKVAAQPDAEAEELTQRIRADFADDAELAEQIIDLNEAFIHAPDHAALATHVVVTQGWGPDEASAAIAQALDG